MLRLFFLLIFAWPVSPAVFRAAIQGEPTGEPPRVEVRSPQSGQALQGSVPVSAVLPADGVQAVEISFSYAGDERETWFLIEEVSDPAASGDLILWDTTTLTDGVYSLRLAVQMAGDDRAIVDVSGLRVRNYSPVETNTPAPPTAAGPGEGIDVTTTPPAPAAVSTTTSPASADILTGPSGRVETSSPEPLPTNTAQVSSQAVMASLRKGALAAGAGFLLLGMYRGVQQVIRNRKDSA
jgi:hypothetical protein